MKKIIRKTPMKLSINNMLFVAGLAFAIAACSNGADEVIQPSELIDENDVELVTETVVEPFQAPAPETLPERPKPQVKQLSPDEEVDLFVKWDQNLRFLTASFVQTTWYDGVQVSRSRGSLAYDKANQLLRVDTLKANGTLDQSAITNKQEIYILDETGQKVTSLAWKDWQEGQPNKALFDFGNYADLLAKHHVIVRAPHQLTLMPKGGEKYTLYITLSPEDHFPTSIKIVSDLMVTQADLTSVQKNNPLGSSTFGGYFQ